MGTSTFESFLKESEGIMPLNGLSTARKHAPGAANHAMMAEQRAVLRSLMRRAAKRGVLPWPEARLEEFAAPGVKQGAITVDLDEALDDDDAFQ